MCVCVCACVCVCVCVHALYFYVSETHSGTMLTHTHFDVNSRLVKLEGVRFGFIGRVSL